MAYGFQGLKSIGLSGEQIQEPPMTLPVKKPAYDPSGYASLSKPSVSDSKGEIAQSPRDIVTAKYGYTPGQMPGINKDVAGVQGTAFNNWDDTTKQSIRKSIAETPVVKKPSVKETVKRAGYNPQESLGDLVATAIDNGGALSDEQIAQYFPEFKGKEKAIGDYFATLNEKPDLTPEETQQYFPEFYDQQAIGMDGGLRATAARGNEERSIYSKIGDALNPAGLLTEFIDNVAQKIPVFDPEAYVDRKTGERVGELTPEKVAEYYKKYESSPNAKKLFGSFDEYIKAKHMTLLEGLIDSPTITMYANMPGSFAKNYSGIARGISNPVDTAIGLYKLAATPEGHAMLMQRYGTQKGREDAIKYDPVGVASDLLTIVEGGANLTRLSAKGTSLVAKAAGAEKLAAGATKVTTQAGEVARVAGGASNLGADIAINKGFDALGSLAEGNNIAEKTVKAVKFAQAPVSETFNVVDVARGLEKGTTVAQVKAVPKKAYAATRKFTEGANEAYARKVTGLSQKAVDTFKSNPTRRNVEAGQLTEDGLMKEVADTIASEKSRLDETGKAYEAVRSKDTVVDVGSQLPDITDKLAKYNISVAPDGKLNFADSALESDAAGQKAIQFAYDVAKRGEIPADIFLNKRLDISNSIDWRSGVSDTANKITKEIRNSLNTAGHRDIAGLGALDETYGPQRKTWNQIAREFIDRETGTLKDSAKSKIMNMTNANKEALLAKIEQYFPDISLKVDALRTAREVDGLKGIKAGTYNKTALIAGGAKAGYELGQRILPWGGLIGAPLGAIAGFIATDPAYIIKRLKGLDAKVPEEIMKKIELKQNLAKKEAGLVQKAISDAAKQSSDRQGLESKFKNYMEAQGKEKPLALPEKTTSNIGTKKNPIVAKAPEGYVAKPVKDLSNMEKIAATPQDAPKKGYETKIGKVTDITNNGGAYPTYRVKVEGSDKRHNIDEIGGVYKPKTEVKMPRQEKTDAPKQEPEGLKVAPGGKKEYYLKLIKEEYGIDINKMDVQDIPKLKEAINSRTPEKAEEILKGLQEKYKGKKKVKVAEKKAPVVDAPKLDMQAKIKKLQDTKMSSVDSMALDDAISLGENGKNRVDAIYTTYFPKGDSVSNPIDMGYGKETPTKSLEAEARKYKSADEFVEAYKKDVIENDGQNPAYFKMRDKIASKEIGYDNVVSKIDSQLRKIREEANNKGLKPKK